MENKILSIVEVTPKTELINGYYLGYWSKDFISVFYKGKHYRLYTELLSDNSTSSVVVIVKDDKISFEKIENRHS